MFLLLRPQNKKKKTERDEVGSQVGADENNKKLIKKS
jgi:hypothetical protein